MIFSRYQAFVKGCQDLTFAGTMKKQTIFFDQAISIPYLFLQ